MDALTLLTGDVQSFLQRNWASQPRIHKADPADLAALLSLADVDTLLTSTALRTPALRVAKDGTVLSSSAFTRSATLAGEPLTGLVDARKVIALFDSGATLVLQGLHHYWEPLTQLVRDLEFALGHPCQANAYLTPPGSQGFALHSDTHDVFVFQTYGSKQWEVHDKDTQLDVLMEPGTCMYLPTGTPHAARTQSTASLHVTVGVNQYSWRSSWNAWSAASLPTRRMPTGSRPATRRTRRHWPASSPTGSGPSPSHWPTSTSTSWQAARPNVSSPAATPPCAGASSTVSWSQASMTTLCSTAGWAPSASSRRLVNACACCWGIAR